MSERAGSDAGTAPGDAAANVDPAEVAKFSELAARWWDPDGEFKPLHLMNPLRVDYVERRAGLEGKKVLDVGCGGGILAEAMAARGASVTGIDASEPALEVARLHGLESGLEVAYRHATAEQVAAVETERYDVVTCLELIEHVPDPVSLVGACARLAAPGGDVIFSTINRTARAYLLAVLGAEYLLRLLPVGTHEYAGFVRPSELDAAGRRAGLRLLDLTGVTLDPLRRRFRLVRDVGVNYLAHFGVG